MEYELEVNGRKLLFGHAANNDYVQDATGIDFLTWYSEKLTMFSKREDGRWEYKGVRDLIEVAIYSGINNYARVIKDRTLKVTFEEAKEFLYELDYDDRNKITNAFIQGFNDAFKNEKQGELKAQTAVN